MAWTAVSYQILAAIWSCQVQAAKSAWICVAIELNWHFQLQPDHDQVQLGQTAVSSKILATTTAVYNKIKAYNNLISIKISKILGVRKYLTARWKFGNCKKTMVKCS